MLLLDWYCNKRLNHQRVEYEHIIEDTTVELDTKSSPQHRKAIKIKQYNRGDNNHAEVAL